MAKKRFPVETQETSFSSQKIFKDDVSANILCHPGSTVNIPLHSWDMTGFASVSITFRQFNSSANRFEVQGSNDGIVWIAQRMWLLGGRPSYIGTSFIPGNDIIQTFGTNKTTKFLRLVPTTVSPSSQTDISINVSGESSVKVSNSIADGVNYNVRYISPSGGLTAATTTIRTNTAASYRIGVYKIKAKNIASTASEITLSNTAGAVIWRWHLNQNETVEDVFESLALCTAGVGLDFNITTTGAAIILNVLTTQINAS